MESCSVCYVLIDGNDMNDGDDAFVLCWIKMMLVSDDAKWRLHHSCGD